mmetsp:Transcript_10031/g.19266  ORF Transcript_10031/g.19266 Transcript_10031/m.19266 type:complete len:115 (+) Transcript_10031:1330-1674(+)
MVLPSIIHFDTHPSSILLVWLRESLLAWGEFPKSGRPPSLQLSSENFLAGHKFAFPCSKLSLPSCEFMQSPQLDNVKLILASHHAYTHTHTHIRTPTYIRTDRQTHRHDHLHHP